jgi:uracil-DNA glycosylase family 4
MKSNDFSCKLCPRINEHFSILKKNFPAYHNGPVVGRGNINSKICIVGLAPGLHGANKTGATFTGDFCSSILNVSLYQSDLNNPNQFYITNALKCLPPYNKPLFSEIKQCSTYLDRELSLMKNLKVIIALGSIAHKSVLISLQIPLKSFKFSHGSIHDLVNIHMIDSYHCSRININTKKLTVNMLSMVLNQAKKYLN